MWPAQRAARDCRTRNLSVLKILFRFCARVWEWVGVWALVCVCVALSELKRPGCSFSPSRPGFDPGDLKWHSWWRRFSSESFGFPPVISFRHCHDQALYYHTLVLTLGLRLWFSLVWLIQTYVLFSAILQWTWICWQVPNLPQSTDGLQLPGYLIILRNQ